MNHGKTQTQTGKIQDNIMASLTGVSVASSYTSLLKLNGNTDSLVAGDGSNAIQVVD